MLDFLSEPEAKVVLGITAVLIITSIAVYVVLNIRGHAEKNMPGSGDYLTNFREMYEQGALDENEFRRVKAELSESLQAETTRNADDQVSANENPVGTGPYPNPNKPDA